MTMLSELLKGADALRDAGVAPDKGCYNVYMTRSAIRAFVKEPDVEFFAGSTIRADLMNGGVELLGLRLIPTT